jgi:hypothetical protein
MLPGLVSITKGGCGVDDEFVGRGVSGETDVAAASVNIAEVYDRKLFASSCEHVASVNNIAAVRANRCKMFLISP